MKSMNLTFPVKIAGAVFVACTMFCAFGQESAAEGQEPAKEDQSAATENAADGEKPAEAAAVVGTSAGKEFRFNPLMRLKEVSGGVVEMRGSEGEEWTASVQGRYYPFGSEVRFTGDGSADASAVLEMGPNALIKLSDGSRFATRKIEIGEKTRTVMPVAGIVGLDMPRSLKDGLITVATPDFVCSNIAGESRFECRESVEGRDVVVRVITGSLVLEGRHYKILRMGAANQVRI